MPSISYLLSFLGAVIAATAAWNSEGCYSSAGSLQSQGTYIYQSIGYCADTCSDGTTIALTGADECFCGQQVPPESDKVEDSRCDAPCYGYPADICGGDSVYSVYTIDNSSHGWFGNASAPASSSASGTTAGSNSTSSHSNTASSTGSSPSSTGLTQYTGAASQQVAALGAAVAFGALAAML